MAPWQTCTDHDKIVEEQRCMKKRVDDLRNEKKFWHRLLGSKWSYIIIPAIIMNMAGWGGWVTKAIYAKDVDKEKITIICRDVQEIKEDNKARDEKREQDRKEEERRREEERKERDRRDRETMKILLDIQKQIRR